MRSDDAIYYGLRNAESGTAVVAVTEAGVTADLPLRLDLANHSPTGFEWGYGGSGPAQLALAILADATDDANAVEHYQAFKATIIAKLDFDGWEFRAEWPRKLTNWQPASAISPVQSGHGL